MQSHILKLSRIRNLQITPRNHYSVIHDLLELKTTNVDDLLDPKVRKLKPKLLYSDYVENRRLKFGYDKNRKTLAKLKTKFQKEKEAVQASAPVMSIALKYLDDEQIAIPIESEQECEFLGETTKKPIHMPYASTDSFKKEPHKPFKHKAENSVSTLNEKYKELYENYLEKTRLDLSENPNNYGTNEKLYADLKVRMGDDFSNIPPTWMTDYEIYNDSLLEDEDVNYGTPNPESQVSSVPCGGCGALLHCKDVALPGYLPSELFINQSDEDLQSVTCQRCHFMENYNTCLDVRVSPEDYPKLIEEIRSNEKALVILLVDLTDFPCSIWPELPSLIGKNRHLFVVGNKIDLLPKDSPHFLDNAKHCLTESLIGSGVTSGNIKHISLISAKTGYGVESLINKLHSIWQYRSDVYLVGCTNAGKSTLFNTLLQSDFCRSQAVDLIQRATTSPWPGTTLSLLKFPILRPTPSRLALRTKRLQDTRRYENVESESRRREFQNTGKIELATLQSRIFHSFKKNHEVSSAMYRAQDGDVITLNKPKKFGLNEFAPEFVKSRWCYDTPGVIQPDQVLHFLTTDELVKTLPDRIISPRTFCIWQDQSMFIAGLGRLDILETSKFIRCTVFASRHLPVTICKTEDADLIYNELLQTDAFVVPINDPDRLKMWPKLESKDLETEGIGEDESVSDVVLSSAGWVSITAADKQRVFMRVWTPQGRGIHLRSALLSKSVTLRGGRKIGSPAYKLGRQVYYANKQKN
ncbi:hypothetical protein QAD02_008503 [Eretmocerus hayati]|uniref:Uncharacterized protein n=1 Tax=Eretmocerus hayati TaxID=131215 RepID=A0ACC2N7H2_9HYME|nr:hypothetical protein QAD02_008503 [Eretmocerus hayati]